ncbi:retrovirus-related pol polyprotein from transposon TNT 1-94 [Tanacetum coccineum]
MVHQPTKFHVQRVDMVINPPWNFLFLDAKGLTSPEQTATVEMVFSQPWTCTFLVAKGLTTPELMANCCCKDKRRRLEVLQIKNKLILMARKRLHIDLDEDDSEGSDDVDKQEESVIGTKTLINPVPVAMKTPSIATYKIIKQGEKGVYQIVREDGTDIVYINFGAMLKSISRDDLTELYRIVMNRYGMDGPEDKLEKGFWKCLRTMFEEPLKSMDVYMLSERKYPLSAEVCQTMLKMKLLDGKMNEDCYRMLKMMEKQAGAKGLTSPEQTATGKGISNPFMAVMEQQNQFRVAASFDSAVHRVHAVSFDAAVAFIVSAACCAAAGYFVYCCCLLCSCCSSILLPQEDLSRNLELTESTPIVPADSLNSIPADYVSAGSSSSIPAGHVLNIVGNANPGNARQIKCYNCNGIGHIARNCTQPKRGQDNAIDEDVDEQPVQDLTLNVDNVFQVDDYDAFDSDVDEAPTAQTMFMANLSSKDPVYDEVGPSYDSDILSEVYDHDHYQDVVCEHHEEHEMHNDVQPNYVVDSHVDYTIDSNMILYDQYVKDNAVPVV